jgi:hypothetical protein
VNVSLVEMFLVFSRGYIFDFGDVDAVAHRGRAAVSSPQGSLPVSERALRRFPHSPPAAPATSAPLSTSPPPFLCLLSPRVPRRKPHEERVSVEQIILP